MTLRHPYLSSTGRILRGKKGKKLRKVPSWEGIKGWVTLSPEGRGIRRVGRAGFTLLELLIATALLAIILTALYSTFFLSSRAIDGLDESLVRLQECRNAVDVIGREAEALMFRRVNTHSFFKLEDRDVYGKQASRLSFTAFSPLTYGLSEISYYVEEKDGVLTLYKKMGNPYKPDDKLKGVELIEGVGSFAVEVKQGDKWVKTWDTSQTGAPPAEIRITITAMLKNRPVSLFETVRPMIGGAI